jgi:hypothetical protein
LNASDVAFEMVYTNQQAIPVKNKGVEGKIYSMIKI